MGTNRLAAWIRAQTTHWFNDRAGNASNAQSSRSDSAADHSATLAFQFVNELNDAHTRCFSNGDNKTFFIDLLHAFMHLTDTKHGLISEIAESAAAPGGYAIAQAFNHQGIELPAPTPKALNNFIAVALAHKKPAILNKNSLSKDLAIAQAGGETDSTQWLVIPLFGGEILAAMVIVGGDYSGDFSFLPVADQLSLTCGNIIRSHLLARQQQDRSKEYAFNLNIAEAINRILQLSLSDLTLQAILQRALDVLLSFEWLSAEQKGCIFLLDQVGHALIMTAHRGIDPRIVRQCTSVTMGKCCCGHAAATGLPMFTDHAEQLEQHVRHCGNGVDPHGHYCMPIKNNQKTIGLINLTLKAGHQYSAIEEKVLDSVANVLAGIIVRKQMEQALDHERKNLAWRVHERTAELVTSNKQLQIEIQERRRVEENYKKAKEAAEAANHAKSDFLASMSHEIRTPLTSILGLVELAGRGTNSLSEEQSSYLRGIKSSADHLLSVIDVTLDLAKIEARKLEPVNVEFDLHDALESIAESLEVQAKKKGLFIRVVIGIDTPRCVKTDLLFLRQILTNLINNAIKFTEQGGITITIKPGSDSQDISGRWIECAVKDTGIGIPQDKQQIIFETFQQADASVRSRHGGSGLGLAISRELIVLLGGRIWVQSDPGQGSTFFFLLPIAVATCPKRQSVSSSSARASPGGPIRILLAEDNPMNSKMMDIFLTKEGHQVTSVANGLLVLEKLREQDFDLVLMDIEMPEMDGLEATRQIRAGTAGSEKSKIPVIALTAHALVGFREQCHAVGMNAYISKPIDFDELKRVINVMTTTHTDSCPTDDPARAEMSL